MKLDRRYHCFGCGADGDVIDFAAALYGLGKKDAAVQLAQDFGLSYEDWKPPGKAKKPKPRQKSPEEQFQEAKNRCFRILADYLHLLRVWRKEYAPHSLSTNEILNQIGSLPERERLTNVVFMGMGEPLDNLDNLLPALEVLTSAWGFGWSPTRITVSTAGVASRLERFLEATQVHLAVSLHNPFPHERAEIMPVEKAWPIREVVEILRRYDFTHQRRVSFEYIVMSGLNDSPRHIRELCRLLDGIKCRINLIRFHKIPGSPYFSPDDRAMIAFRDALTAKGIHTTIRTSRGEDIQAACGLLSTAQNEAAQF